MTFSTARREKCDVRIARIFQWRYHRTRSESRSDSLNPLSQAKHSTRGFTILEMMVVLVIIGVIIAGAMLSVTLTGDDRELEDEARRFTSLLNLVNEEALLQGRDYGLELAEQDYRFMVYDNDNATWLHLEQDDLLRPRVLPQDIRLQLSLESREVVLQLRTDIDPTETPQPQIILLSSGELTPFVVRMERAFDNRSFTITGELSGGVELENSSDGF